MIAPAMRSRISSAPRPESHNHGARGRVPEIAGRTVYGADCFFNARPMLRRLS
jgi:hypothetical protein